MLASGIAHEIKNPLVAIKTFAQLLPRRHADAQFVEEFGRIAAREIQRMERLLERLRTLSRPSDRPRQPLDLRVPIAEAAETMRPPSRRRPLPSPVTTPPAPCVIRGDHAELGQLFLNLLMNAHEATPPHGSLRIEVSVTETHATVAVLDGGPGVPTDLIDHVFEPFFTTKQRGSGLGLAICAAIGPDHDGEAQGRQPTGGRRRLQRRVSARRRGARARVGVNTVLVVTHDDALRTSLLGALDDYSTFIAQSDTEALKILRLIDIDVILRDCVGSPRGLEAFAARVKEIQPSTLTVAIRGGRRRG